jgi:hypothetical protein
MTEFLLGADPEFSLIDTEVMRTTSAHDLVPGTKANPQKITGGWVQADGTMVEYNIPPAKSAKEFVDNNAEVLKSLREMIPEKYVFSFRPTVHYDPYYFSHVPHVAKELGCSADYNAWKGGGINPRPQPPLDRLDMRTCSGHLHLGFTKDQDPDNMSHRWDCCQLVKLLEVAICPYMPLWDSDTQRQVLYGRPGAFRPKSYGVEWRVPSNAWLNYPEIQGWLFDACKSVFLTMKAGHYPLVKLQSTVDYSSRNVEWGLNRTRKDVLKDFPDFNGGWRESIEKKNQELRDKHGVPKPIHRGVRVASSSYTVNYDLDLDIKGEDRKYASPYTIKPLTIDDVIN